MMRARKPKAQTLHPEPYTLNQGFHDVCSVLVLVMGGREQAAPLARRLASGYMREAMHESIKGAMQALSLICMYVCMYVRMYVCMYVCM